MFPGLHDIHLEKKDPAKVVEKVVIVPRLSRSYGNDAPVSVFELHRHGTFIVHSDALFRTGSCDLVPNKTAISFEVGEAIGKTGLVLGPNKNAISCDRSDAPARSVSLSVSFSSTNASS